MHARSVIRSAVYGVLLCIVQSFCHAQSSSVAKAAVTPANASSNPAYKLVDTSGKPLAGVKVFIQQRPWFPLAEEVVETTPSLSGAKGEFELPEDAPPGSLIVFEKDGYATRGFNSGEELPEEIVLQPGEAVMGNVVDEKGTSITGALVGPVTLQGRLTQESGKRVPLVFETTDNGGRFTLSGLSKGRYDVLVQAPDKIARLVTMITGVEKKVLLESGGTTVTGTVRGAKDQQPKAGEYVEALSPGIKLYAKTSADGRFTFGNLAPREWRFRVAGTTSSSSNNPSQILQIEANPSGYDIELLMTQGLTVAGQVLNAETSAPISDMNLRLDTDPIRTTKTDASGNFSFQNVETFGDVALRFDATRYAYEENGQNYEYHMLATGSNQDITTVTLHLIPRIMLQGRVTDTVGRGVGGAQVVARSLSGGTVRIGKDLRAAQYSARSRPNGEFAFGVSPAGKYEVLASTVDKVAPPQAVDVYSTTSANATLVLGAAVEVAGRVVDASDQPVTAAVVKVYAGDEAPESDVITPLKQASSDAKAEFRIEGLPPARFTLVAKHPHFIVPAKQSVMLDTVGSSSIVLKFPAGSDLQLLVVDKATRRAIEGAEVKLLYTADEQKMVSKETDEDGRAGFRGLPTSKVDRVSVDVKSYNPYEISDIAASGQQMVIELAKRSRIDVKIEESGTPADATADPVTVYLLHAENSSASGGATPPSESFNVRDQKSAEQGKTTFEDVTPGWYKPAARRGSIYSEGEAFELTESQTKEVIVALQPGGAIRGKVIDKKTRQPISEAAIKVDAAIVGIPEAGGQAALSAADGTFTIASAPAGDVKLTVIHEKYPEHQQALRVTPAQPQDVIIELSSELATVSGNITYGAQPLQDALVVLYKGRTENPIAQAVTDASGRYQLENVPSGEHLITVEAPIGETGKAGHKSVSVKVEGAAATADVKFEKLTIAKGRVRMRGAAPSGESTVMFIPVDPGLQSIMAPVAADGTYTAELEPGRYTVSLDDRPGREVNIPPTDNTYPLDLNF